MTEGITNTKTSMGISKTNIGPSGTTAIASALTNNTSLEELHMDKTTVGAAAVTIAKAITNKNTLKRLSLKTVM